ncbi:MAG: hypothetical protein ACREGH_01240 [Minisyncoccia bacterium]
MANSSQRTGVEVVAGVGAALAAAAGAYWLYGAKDAKRHRKLAKSWMLKARAEVMEQVEKVGNLNRQQYMDMVDKVVAGYSAAKGASEPELAKLTRDLRSAWAHMNAGVSKGTKAAVKSGRSKKKAAKKSRR